MEYNQHLSKIADYHPRVNEVDLISGSWCGLSVSLERREKILAQKKTLKLFQWKKF